MTVIMRELRVRLNASETLRLTLEHARETVGQADSGALHRLLLA